MSQRGAYGFVSGNRGRGNALPGRGGSSNVRGGGGTGYIPRQTTGLFEYRNDMPNRIGSGSTTGLLEYRNDLPNRIGGGSIACTGNEIRGYGNALPSLGGGSNVRGGGGTGSGYRLTTGNYPNHNVMASRGSTALNRGMNGYRGRGSVVTNSEGSGCTSRDEGYQDARTTGRIVSHDFHSDQLPPLSTLNVSDAYGCDGYGAFGDLVSSNNMYQNGRGNSKSFRGKRGKNFSNTVPQVSSASQSVDVPSPIGNSVSQPQVPLHVVGSSENQKAIRRRRHTFMKRMFKDAHNAYISASSSSSQCRLAELGYCDNHLYIPVRHCSNCGTVNHTFPDPLDPSILSSQASLPPLDHPFHSQVSEHYEEDREDEFYSNNGSFYDEEEERARESIDGEGSLITQPDEVQL